MKFCTTFFCWSVCSCCASLWSTHNATPCLCRASVGHRYMPDTCWPCPSRVNEVVSPDTIKRPVGHGLDTVQPDPSSNLGYKIVLTQPDPITNKNPKSQSTARNLSLSLSLSLSLYSTKKAMIILSILRRRQRSFSLYSTKKKATNLFVVDDVIVAGGSRRHQWWWVDLVNVMVVTSRDIFNGSYLRIKAHLMHRSWQEIKMYASVLNIPDITPILRRYCVYVT